MKLKTQPTHEDQTPEWWEVEVRWDNSRHSFSTEESAVAYAKEKAGEPIDLRCYALDRHAILHSEIPRPHGRQTIKPRE